MDQSNHQVANIPLDRLVAGALSQLEKLRYSKQKIAEALPHNLAAPRGVFSPDEPRR
jgi:hypothetical protein